MSTFQTISAQIKRLLDSANATTGNANTTLTDGVNALIEGFGKGGAEELYEALKDTGIVTKDMTFEEMCEVLKEYFSENYKLYMSSANEGGFSAYAGSTHAAYEYVNFAPSVTFEDKMTVIGSQKYQNAYGNGCVISEPIDLTNFSRIFFDYECSLTEAANNSMSVFITPIKQPLLSSVVHFNEYLIEGRHYLTSSGIKGIDVSELSGEYYIGFSMMYTSPATIKISNMYATAIKK